jgi:HD-GYP domain-containing protein (c-di-GMP phosphodiesterase class II)
MQPAPTQTDALALVREVTAAVASTHDVDEVLQRIARLTGQAVDVTECDIYEYDARARRLTATATWSTISTPQIDADWLGDTLDIDVAIEYRQALESRAPVEEHLDDPGLSPMTRGLMEQWGEKCWLIVPLVFGDLPIGCLLLVEHREMRQFSEEERELVATLAVPAAIAIQNARLYRRMAEQNRFLGSLVDSSRAMSSTVDLDDLLHRVAREACESLRTSQAAVYIHDAEQEALIYRIAYKRIPTRGEDDPLGAVATFAEQPGNRAILFSDDIVIEYESDTDLPADRRHNIERWSEKTVLSVPLRFQDKRLGVLRLYEFDEERAFSLLELQLARGLGELAGAAIHNAQSFQREQVRSLELETLLEASKAMTSSMDLKDVLGQLAQRAAVALGSPECLIYEYDAARDVTILRSAFDADGADADDENRVGTEYALDEFPSDREVLQRGEIVEEHISDPDMEPDVRASMEMFGEKACLTVPLVFRGRSLGIMELIETKVERHFTQGETDFARALAEQAATALNNARLFQRSKDYAARLESSYLETVTALAAAMEAKDHYTAEHADMLATMAVMVGRRMGLSEADLRDLQYASVLHDIGKIGIPGHILNKPDRLTDEEFAVMAEHTIIGERIISRIDYLAPIGKAIRAAHERWDGRGYPDQLAGEQIPLPSRILFVCDAFHAMTSDRPYRGAMPHEDALEELRRNAGAQFDPMVVQAFFDVWPQLAADGDESAARALN